MSTMRMRRRWGDNDRYFGPFTFARDKGYRPLAVVLSSAGDDYDEGPFAHLRISGFGFTFISAMPAIIKPWRRWVDTSRHEWSKGPGSGYWDIYPNQYGFSLSDGFLQLFLGPQTHDSGSTKSWSTFLPWKEWRHVRRSFYGLNGEHVATLPDGGKFDAARWERERATEDAVPTVSFHFLDFDEEALVATTKIEEREWRFGTGHFKWLSWFRKPRIIRSLDISFSGETGERKGSWKGGTVGHSVEMLPGELHEASFRRYCDAHKMTFVGAA